MLQQRWDIGEWKQQFHRWHFCHLNRHECSARNRSCLNGIGRQEKIHRLPQALTPHRQLSTEITTKCRMISLYYCILSRLSLINLLIRSNQL
jgi:hypothetical protein